MIDTKANIRVYEAEYNRLMNRISSVYRSEPGFKNAQNYIKGLLGSMERKNGWQLSEYLGEETPYKIQQFIYRGEYSADEMRDKLRDYIGESLGENDGVMVIDDTGFIKKGKKSCGVKCQYSGTAGKVENCQIGVFLTYASSKGHSPIDRRLYIPKDWADDRVRLKEAGVPETVTFKTKPQMGLEMIKEATEAGIPYMWVTGDCAYGDYREIRNWLEKNKKCYVMCVSGKEYIWDGDSQVTVASVINNLPPDGWLPASCGDGSKGERIYDWQAFEIETDRWSEGWKRVMLIRRSKTDPKDIRAHICHAPNDTPDEKFIQTAGVRWTVERCFQDSKSEVGLDQYEVRSHDGWYRHITFACLALALLTVLSNLPVGKDNPKSMQQFNPGSSSLDEFKRGRYLRV